MKKGELIERNKNVVAPVLGHYNDLEITGGKGAYLFGSDGKDILDFSCGIAVTPLGHCHPKVVAAVKAQASNLMHICIGVAYYEKYIELAEKLSKITAGGLDKVFLCQDGSGAIEAAMKLAKYTSKKSGIISFTGSFHGRTFGAMSVTNSKEKYKKGYEPLMANTYEVGYPYCYRCKWHEGKACSPKQCSYECIKELETAVSSAGADKIAAVLIEPILGEGGYIVPPDDYLKKVKDICSSNNIVLIFDEVQTGFGRSGKMFAYEHSGVVPDIMCMAKGIANGLPLGGIIANKELIDAWTTGAHGGTFGGNPVCCAASLATIQTIEDKKLVSKSEKLGKYLTKQLKKLKEKHKVIGDIRGKGLMIGVEFIKDGGEPDPDAVKAICKDCLDNGLLLISCGSHDQVIRFIPPLIVNKKQLNEALGIFEKALAKI